MPPINLGSDLILLERCIGVVNRLFCKILQQFAEGLGAPQTMTFNNAIYLLVELLGASGERACHSHLTVT